MPKYVIERNMPGVGGSTPQELQGACQKSNDTISAMSGAVQWQHSYVTDDKLYCVYIAENEQAVQEHAKRSGFPASKISQVMAVIDPVTAE